jgi:hypothetical protein
MPPKSSDIALPAQSLGSQSLQPVPLTQSVRLSHFPVYACSAVALLHVASMPSPGLLWQRPPAESLHVVRYKHRKLAITRFEVDPDAEAGMREAAAGGSSSNSSGPACGSGLPGSKTSLEF